MTVSDASLDESGSNFVIVAATSLLLGVTRTSSDAHLLSALRLNARKDSGHCRWRVNVHRLSSSGGAVSEDAAYSADILRKLRMTSPPATSSDAINDGSRASGKINNPDPAVSIFDGSSVVFAIPQSSSGAKGPTKAYFTTQNGGNAVNEITLPAVQWEPGVIYSYCFVISQSKIEVEITIKDWEPVEINQDIHII